MSIYKEIPRAVYSTTWPNQFITGQLPDQGDLSLKDYHKLLVANALCAWGNILSGHCQPKQLPLAMVLTGKELGITATSENLMVLSKQLLEQP